MLFCIRSQAQNSNPIITIATEGFPKITNIKGDTDQIKKLVRKGLQHRFTKDDSASMMLKNAFDQSYSMGYINGMGRALLSLGLVAMEKGQYQQTHLYFEKAAQFSHSTAVDPNFLADFYHYNGILSFYEGAYANATYYYYMALQEGQQRNLPRCPMIYLYSNLAAVFLRLEQNDQALYYLTMGEYMASNNHCAGPLAYIYNNKGNFYLSNNKFDTAWLYYQKSLLLAKQIKDYPAIQAATANLGETLIKQNKPKEAIAYLQQAMDEEHTTNPYYSNIQPLYLLGRAYSLLKEYDKAKEALHTAINNAQALSINEDVANAYHILSNIYEKSGDYKQALVWHERYTTLKDSLTNADKTKLINQLDVKYRTAEKDREINAHQLLIAEQEHGLEKKNILIAGSVAALMVFAVILIGLYRYYRQRQYLQAEQLRSLQQEQKIEILQAMMNGEEKERSRIGRELHDGIGGLLSAMKMNFSIIQNEHAEIGNKENFHRVIRLLDETASEVRKTAHNLMPEMLYRHGLIEALSIFCEVSQGNGLQIYFQAYGTFDSLIDEMQLSVYRAIQELVQNITKHAKATEALVQLSRHDNIVSISIEDNGIGFDTAITGNGLGLQTLNSRIKAMNGHFSLVSGNGSGTKVYIEFDLQQLSFIEAL